MYSKLIHYPPEHLEWFYLCAKKNSFKERYRVNNSTDGVKIMKSSITAMLRNVNVVYSRPKFETFSTEIQ